MVRQQIWKVRCDLTRGFQFDVLVPKGAQALSVGYQGEAENIAIWLLVDTLKENVIRRFQIFGTGRDIPADLGKHNFIGRATMGPLEWHVFDVGQIDAVTPSEDEIYRDRLQRARDSATFLRDKVAEAFVALNAKRYKDVVRIPDGAGNTMHDVKVEFTPIVREMMDKGLFK